MGNPLDDAINEAMSEAEVAAEAEEPAEPEPEPEVEEEIEVDDEIDVEGEVDDGEPDLEDFEDGDPDATDVDDEVEGDDEDDVEQDADEDGEQQSFTVKVDGEQLEVSLEDLKAGYQRQEDYTRKTQELAEQREQVEQTMSRMKDWYETRAADPGGWMLEIAGQTDNPAGTLADAIQRTSNPTGLVAWTIRELTERGKLTPEFVERFGLQEIEGTAADAEKDTRIERLEQRLEQQEQSQAERQRTQQIVAEYERQWETVKDDESLTFSDPKAELDARVSVMKFARDNEIADLDTAYAAMKGKGIAPTSDKPEPDNGSEPDDGPSDEEVKKAVRRKRKTRAMTRKPVSGKRPKPRSPGDLDAVIGEAAEELGLSL